MAEEKPDPSVFPSRSSSRGARPWRILKVSCRVNAVWRPPRLLDTRVLSNFPQHPLPGGEQRLHVQAEPQGLGPPKPVLAAAPLLKCAIDFTASEDVDRQAISGVEQGSIPDGLTHWVGGWEGPGAGVQISDKSPWLRALPLVSLLVHLQGQGAHCLHFHIPDYYFWFILTHLTGSPPLTPSSVPNPQGPGISFQTSPQTASPEATWLRSKAQSTSSLCPASQLFPGTSTKFGVR